MKTSLEIHEFYLAIKVDPAALREESANSPSAAFLAQAVWSALRDRGVEAVSGFEGHHTGRR